MAGILTTIREGWAAYLLTSTEAPDAGGQTPAEFFAHDPAIPVYTEKLKSIEDIITNALKRLPLSVVIATVEAKKAQGQFKGCIAFDQIVAVARVFENPKINFSGISASDLAEAVAIFTRKFRPFEDSTMALQDITLGNDPRALCYDVTYLINAKQRASVNRADYLVDDTGYYRVDEQGRLRTTGENLTPAE